MEELTQGVSLLESLIVLLIAAVGVLANMFRRVAKELKEEWTETKKELREPYRAVQESVRDRIDENKVKRQ